MWRAAAFANGSWRPVEVFARDSEVPTSKASLELAREAIATPFQGLLRHFEQEAELSRFPYFGREAIEIWARDAENENREFNRDSPGNIEERDGALTLTWRDKLQFGEPLNPITLAWHDRSFFMLHLRGDEERVLVEYIPNESEARRADDYRSRFATERHHLETILEWRGYYGRECGIIDNWQIMRSHGNGFLASVYGTAGYIGGCVTRRLIGYRGPLYTADPTRASRLDRMSMQYPDVSRAVPEISSLGSSPIETTTAVVFVHGTLSCGIQGLKDLYPTLSLLSGDPKDKPQCVYRYEHDTFASPLDNAKELANLIGQRLKADQLLIAAHSRGGLVARLTANLLRQNTYGGQVTVYTFGTPHLGTPLVHLGRGVLNALLNVGENVVGAIPLCSPLVKALSYVYSPAELPPGIEFMDERSQAREVFNALDETVNVGAWGAKFDVNSSPSSFGAGATGFLLGSLGTIANDLVVPTASALGYGRGRPVLSCSHTQYFLDAGVRAAIRAFEPPPPQPGPPEVPGPITEDEDSVTINWIRIPKRKG